MPVFPPDDPLDEIKAMNLRLPQRLWERLDAIAQLEGKSRNTVAEYFLNWACDDYHAQARAPRKATSKAGSKP